MSTFESVIVLGIFKGTKTCILSQNMSCFNLTPEHKHCLFTRYNWKLNLKKRKSCNKKRNVKLQDISGLQDCTLPTFILVTGLTSLNLKMDRMYEFISLRAVFS